METDNIKTADPARSAVFLCVYEREKHYLHICVENSRAKKLPGRPGRKGYGLEILHDLVERNHGQIDVQPGEGSFRVDVTVENF
jgi:two-component sensor histidine kinase